MKPGESLKQYISYFQSQMALMYNCNYDVVVAVFINGLLVTYSFYKHLVKHDAPRCGTSSLKLRSISRSRTRPEAQLIALSKGRIMRRNRSLNLPSQKRMKMGFLTLSKPCEDLRRQSRLTPFKISVDHVFDAIKDQEWVRRPRPLPPNPKGPGAGKYCIFHDGMGRRTVDCRSFRRQLQELVNRGYLKKFILNPWQFSETKVQKEVNQTPRQESQVNQAPIQYREVNTIFGTSDRRQYTLVDQDKKTFGK